MIKKGSLIEVEDIYCDKNIKLKVFTRGKCMYDCEIGEQVSIKTITGHVVKGTVSRDKLLYSNICNLGKDAKEIVLIKKWTS